MEVNITGQYTDIADLKKILQKMNNNKEERVKKEINPENVKVVNTPAENFRGGGRERVTFKLRVIEDYKKRLNRVIQACEELQESTESLVTFISSSDTEIQIQNVFKFSNEDITALIQKIDQLYHHDG